MPSIMQQQQRPLILNQRQAAEILGVTTRTIYNWEQEKRLQRLTQFKSARYSLAQLERLAGNLPELEGRFRTSPADMKLVEAVAIEQLES